MVNSTRSANVTNRNTTKCSHVFHAMSLTVRFTTARKQTVWHEHVRMLVLSIGLLNISERTVAESPIYMLSTRPHPTSKL